MIVRKVRGKNEISRITLSRAEVELVKRMGMELTEYVKQKLPQIAKQRRWKWYFNKEKNTCPPLS